MSAIVRLICYQLCKPPSFTRTQSHTLHTNRNFTPELLICAAGNLNISNLTYSARLLDCQRPTLVFGMKISFISLSFVLGGKSACFSLLLCTVCYIMNASCCSMPFRDQLNRYFCPLLAADWVSASKICGANHALLSLQIY
jgi:hypothetical protein